MLVNLSHEWWFASQICGKGNLCTLFYGITDVAIRKSRVRQAIIERGLRDEKIGKGTYAEAYERLYGEPLE